MRGRKSVSDRFFHFDSVGYLHAIRQAMREASYEIKDYLSDEVRRNINRLPFKNNKVPLVNGNTTSDEKRSNQLVESVEQSVGQYLSSKHTKKSDAGWKSSHQANKTIIPVNVSAMGKHYKDSHIGWYYEYGTGAKEEVPFAGYWETDAVNPLRKGFGSNIVSRPAGVWKDAGGNIRRTKGKGGVRNLNFLKFIGEDVEAHRWFSKALHDNRNEIISIYLKHIRSVDYRKYVHVKSRVILGRK